MSRYRETRMRVSDVFRAGRSTGGDADWCRSQRDQAVAAGADISEMDCAVNGTHYPDPRSPNAARWD